MLPVGGEFTPTNFIAAKKRFHLIGAPENGRTKISRAFCADLSSLRDFVCFPSGNPSAKALGYFLGAATLFPPRDGLKVSLSRATVDVVHVDRGYRHLPLRQ